MNQYTMGEIQGGIGNRTTLEPIKDGWSMDPKERAFLEASERGDKHTILRCLQPPNPVNVNCTDMLGRSAIQIAVDNENVEIVEILLQQDGVFIGDALLYAIREGHYGMVEMLIDHPSITPDMLASGWYKVRKAGEESYDYSPDISPVILAAHCNQFEILQLLLNRGAMIEKPHFLNCECQKCQMGKHTDGLRYSLKRIHIYRALASPAWISLTSSDPILVAFKLSWELTHLAQEEPEFKSIYLELSKQCRKFTCDLLNLCRSTEEVIAVMDKKSESDSEDEEDDGEGEAKLSTSFSRLKLAIKYEQKQFVAHSNCQQLLTTIWYDGIPIWRQASLPMKVLVCLGLMFGLPLVSLYYLILPKTKFGMMIRSPFVKFVHRTASFAFFLLLLLIATFSNDRATQHVRGPPLTAVEWLISFWVVGMVWGECKEIWSEGISDYVRQYWNWLDFLMLTSYIASFSLKGVASILVSTGNYGPKLQDRGHWPDNDPTLIAEAIFAIANVFSFARIIYLFQTNPHLGPLQISLGCMFKDIAKFLFTFFLVLVSFVLGLFQLYWSYDSNIEHCQTYEHGGETVTLACAKNPDAFSTMTGTFGHLFWTLFGISTRKSTDLYEDDTFIETLGEGLFLAYHVITIIVLVNMLIAMMTKSFEVITNQADMEWKFARSKLWLGFFDDGSTLPPPFNLIISPKSVYQFYANLNNLWHSLKKSETDPKEPTNENMGSFGYNQDNDNQDDTPIDNYQETMKLLVSRYIHQCKLTLRQDGVNEDDLLEIKQDISSLRYELRDDRKKEAIRTSLQIENIKRDIIRSLRCEPGLLADLKRKKPVFKPNPNLNSQSERSGNRLSRQEVDRLKNSIAIEVKNEMINILRELREETL